ncbi:MAG: hypothetical protein R2799_13520 [Crocinitomicaceae bacterium]
MDIRLCFLLMILGFFSACKKTEPYDSDLDYSYFPIEEGKFIEYQVLEISHDINLNPSIDSNLYYLKVSIGEKILSNTGDSVNKLIFYTKPHPDSMYLLDKVNTIYNNGFQGIYNLDNQKYIKLAFPARVGVNWNINACNTSDPLNSSVVQKDFSGSVNGINFSSLLLTEQLDFFSLVDYQKAYEIYAKDIGLVRIYFKDLTIQNFDTTQIKKGEEVYWNYLSSGQE